MRKFLIAPVVAGTLALATVVGVSAQTASERATEALTTARAVVDESAYVGLDRADAAVTTRSGAGLETAAEVADVRSATGRTTAETASTERSAYGLATADSNSGGTASARSSAGTEIAANASLR